METADLVLSRGRNKAIWRTAQTDPRPDEKNAHATSKGVGARPGRPPQSVRRCASQGGIFIDPSRGKSEGDSQADVGMGNEAPCPVRNPQESATGSKTSATIKRMPASV